MSEHVQVCPVLADPGHNGDIISFMSYISFILKPSQYSLIGGGGGWGEGGLGFSA